MGRGGRHKPVFPSLETKPCWEGPVAPLAGWGLGAYILYQAWAFDEPLAFMKTQAHWAGRSEPSWAAKAVDLVTLEPIRAVYDPNSQCYWARVPPRDNCLFNLHFLNPIYFVLTAVVLAVGAKWRWLTTQEWLLELLALVFLEL